MRPAPNLFRGYTLTMNKPRILLPLAVAGLVLSAALTTAALLTAAENPIFKPDTARVFPPAEVNALFTIAPVSDSLRAKLVYADAALQQAEVNALFDVAPMSAAMRAKLTKADDEAALQQAEVDAMFAVGPMTVPKQSGPAKDPQSERGRGVYLGLCFACHMPDGKGLASVFPPLAGSDFLLADRDRAIRIVLKGLIGPVTVNGITFNSAMPPLETTLAEQQIADVLTYVTGEWGNKGTAYTVDDVRRVKNDVREHQGLLSVAP